MGYRTGKAFSRSVLFVCLSILVSLTAFGGDAHAKGSYLDSFTTKYPAAAGSKLDSCNTCHGSGGTSTFNPYGQAVKSASGADITARITAIAGQDSDGDGFTNQVEITALTFPGDATDKPASGGTPPPPPPPAGDTTPPAVSSTSPANGAAGVAANASVTATFSEAVDPATVTTATFKLQGGAAVVAGTVSLSGNTATFRPSASLAPGTTYSATVTTGVKDLAGNAMAANRTWTFTTGAAADTTPPAVSSTSPANNQSGVAVSAKVTATFSEAVDPATVTPASFTLKSGGSAVAGTVSLSGATATFTPSAPLASGTAYMATLTTVIKDAAGNALAANYSWTFTTGTAADTTPPAVSSTDPSGNESGVAIGAVVTATFSEAINPATVTPSSFTVSSGGSAVVGTVSVDGSTATFTPSAPLFDSTTYTATITTAVKDLAGNALPAVHTTTFTTVPAAETTPPPTGPTTPSVPAEASESAGGGGCSMAAGSRGDVRDLAGAYGFLILSALGIAIRGRVKRGNK
jgi:hypothetical protein